MHPLVTVGESFVCVLLSWSFQENVKERNNQWSKSSAFFFKSFVAVAVTHNAVNGLYTVSSGDVKQSIE